MKGRGSTGSIALLLALTILTALRWNSSAAPTIPVKTHLDLRYEMVVRQTTWYTCGPAAVATLLTHFFDVPTTEADVILSVMGDEQEKLPETGFSLLSLKDALSTLGLEAKVYRLTVDALTDYFERGGLPVIVHVTVPEAHFIVAVAVVGAHFIVADPSTGVYMLPVSAVVKSKGFSGNVLITMPDAALMPTVSDRQDKLTARFRTRYAQLGTLGGRLR